MNDPESKISTAADIEGSLKRTHSEIFKNFDLLRIREAITHVAMEVPSLQPSNSDNQEQQRVSRDSWVLDVPDDFSDRIIEILESDERLTEQIKKTFYIALTNGHMDRVIQLRRACSDIRFDKEIEDAFNDAYASGNIYLLKEIAELHPKLSYEELLSKVQVDEKSD